MNREDIERIVRSIVADMPFLTRSADGWRVIEQMAYRIAVAGR